MADPNPKHQSVRARANVRSTRATLHEVAPEDVEIPALPTRYKKNADGILQESVWRLETQDWWEAIWSSPMSTEFHSSDTHGLYMLAALVDSFWDAPDAQHHSEVRLARKDYGLTPLDRRRLEWTIESASAAKDAGTKRRNAAAPQGVPQPEKDGDDPRAIGLAG